MPTMAPTKATTKKVILQPCMPMTDIEATRTEENPPMMEPRFPVRCNHPKVVPRLLSSVESAMTD
jgi:hypothetical protein